MSEFTIQYGNRQVSVNFNEGQLIIKTSTGEKHNFNVGDMAVYDVYNMSYVGTIKKITPKTVIIEKWYNNAPLKRLSHEKFAMLNWDFDIERIKYENHLASMNT